MDKSIPGNDDRKQMRELMKRFADEIVEISCFEELIDLQMEVGAERYVAAMELTISQSTGTERLAGCMMLHLSHPKSVIAERAIGHLHQELYEGDEECRRAAVRWLAWTRSAWPSAVPELAKFLSVQEEGLNYWAASAMCHAAQYGKNDWPEFERIGEAWEVLDTALKSGDVVGVVLAASAFGHLGVRQENALEKLFELTVDATEGEKLMLVGAMGKVKDSAAVPYLESVLRSSEVQTGVKCMAIKSLGEISQGDDDAERVAIEAISHSEPAVVLMAASIVYRREGRLPSAAVDRLLEQLASERAELRAVAARFIAYIGPPVGCALPRLMWMLEHETDNAVCKEVVAAVSAAGIDAMPGLIELLRQNKIRTMPLVQMALLGIGEQAAGEVARLCLTTDNSIVRQAASWVLASLGPKAAPAVPVLLELLDSADREVVTDTIVAFGNLGRVGKDCTNRLATFLWDRDETIREWAKQALISIGPEAVPTLERLQADVDEEKCERIDEVLTGLHALMGLAVVDRGVKGVTDINTLELFKVVGDLLLEHGRLSQEKLSVEIGKMKKKRKLRKDLPCSERQIGLVIERMEKAIFEQDGTKTVLVNRKAGVKGGLTPAGESLHFQVAKYLRRKGVSHLNE